MSNIQLFLGVTTLFLTSCFWSSDVSKKGLEINLPPGVQPVYEGGLYKVIASIPDGCPPEALAWRTGAATLIRQNHGYANGLITSDTAFLEWQNLPTVKIDTTKITDTAGKSKSTYDTSFVDHIGFSALGVDSPILDIKIQNFLPKMDSVIINGQTQKTAVNMMQLSAHRGEALKFKIYLSDGFNKLYKPVIEFSSPQISKIFESDTTAEYLWRAPDSLMEDTISLRMRDSRGLGFKDILIHRLTYNESGSMWIGAGNQFYKISEFGQIIYTSPTTYKEISDIAVHPTRSEVWIADAAAKSVTRLDREGNYRSKDSTLIQPSALGIDVVSNILQIADQDIKVKGRLRAYDVSNADSSRLLQVLDSNLTGPISYINIDQYDATVSWYTVPEMDLVLKVRGTKKDTLKLRDTTSKTNVTINRPSFVAYDARSSKVWISDSTSLILADTSGIIRARIYGFEFVGGVAASKGEACVIDSRQNKYYRFNTQITGLNRSTKDALHFQSGFAKPISVDISYSDGSCWVADRDAGSLVKINSAGSVVKRISGFKLPSVLRIHKGVE